jgi:hypothetical protein
MKQDDVHATEKISFFDASGSGLVRLGHSRKIKMTFKSQVTGVDATFHGHCSCCSRVGLLLLQEYNIVTLTTVSYYQVQQACGSFAP